MQGDINHVTNFDDTGLVSVVHRCPQREAVEAEVRVGIIIRTLTSIPSPREPTQYRFLAFSDFMFDRTIGK
jgi:hypothetical protein